MKLLGYSLLLCLSQLLYEFVFPALLLILSPLLFVTFFCCQSAFNFRRPGTHLLHSCICILHCFANLSKICISSSIRSQVPHRTIKQTLSLLLNHILPCIKSSLFTAIMPSQPTSAPYTYSRSSVSPPSIKPHIQRPIKLHPKPSTNHTSNTLQSIVSFDNMHEEAFPTRTASISSTTSTTSTTSTSSQASKLDTKDIASANRLRYATHVAAMFGVSPTTLAATLIPTSTCASGHDHL